MEAVYNILKDGFQTLQAPSILSSWALATELAQEVSTLNKEAGVGTYIQTPAKIFALISKKSGS